MIVNAFDVAPDENADALVIALLALAEGVAVKHVYDDLLRHNYYYGRNQGFKESAVNIIIRGHYLVLISTVLS